MSFKIILIILLALFLINKLLDRIIKLSQEAKDETKKNLNISINKDFESLIINYLGELGYSNIGEPDHGEVTVYNNDAVVLVAYRQCNKLEEEISNEEIVKFIANMNIKSIKKGIFLTNGLLGGDIKETIKNKLQQQVDLEVIEGIPLIVKLKKIKLQQLGFNI